MLRHRYNTYSILPIRSTSKGLPSVSTIMLLPSYNGEVVSILPSGGNVVFDSHWQSSGRRLPAQERRH